MASYLIELTVLFQRHIKFTLVLNILEQSISGSYLMHHSVAVRPRSS